MTPTIDDLAYIYAHRVVVEAALANVLNAEKPRDPGRGEDDRSRADLTETPGNG